MRVLIFSDLWPEQFNVMEVERVDGVENLGSLTPLCSLTSQIRTVTTMVPSCLNCQRKGASCMFE